jgi:signal transduction histidine kinase
MSRADGQDTAWLYQLAAQLSRQRLQSQAIMKISLQHLRDLMGATYGCIALVNGSGTIGDVYSHDEENSFTQELWELGLLHNLIESVSERQQPTYWNHLTFQDGWDRLSHPTFRQPGSAAAIPLVDDGLHLGIIVLMHGQPDCFSDAHDATLRAAAALITSELANARQFEQLANAFEDQTGNDRLRRDLSAMILHDLRGPLNNILASLSRMERLKLTNPGQQMVEIAGHSARQMGRMIKSLLDVEQLETKERILKREPVHLYDLLMEAADLVRALAHDADQELLVDVPDHLPLIRADRDMILRVITNLLENAIKHTPEHGRVVTGVRVREEAIVVVVADSGPGIPPAMQHTIFDKYVRLKRDLRSEGYGLGLAFCRLAIDAHEGDIWVESAPTGGSVFAFTLPIQQEPVVAATPARVS